MKKANITLFVFVLVSFMIIFPLFGKTYRFELPRDTALNGVRLDAGVYQLKLNSTETRAEILGRGKVAVVARVEVKPLGSATGDTILISRDGNLSEYRSDRQKIRFLGLDPQNVSSGN